LSIALLFVAQAEAQRDLRMEGSAQKLALIVGNESYPKWPLRNPVNDAKAMDQALRSTGFETEVLLNADLRNLERSIDRFIGRVRNGDVVLFFYAGHGIQVNGENYLVPVDFDAKDEADAKYVSYSASRLQDRLDAAGARLTIIVLDACRNNPFRATRAAGGGLATMNSGKGTLIAFATSPGKTADDNPNGSNGLFTSHLVQALKEPGLSLDQVFNRVRERVYTESAQKQLPWTVSSVIGEYYFQPGSQRAPVPQRATPGPSTQPAESGLARLVAPNNVQPAATPPPPPATNIAATESQNAYGRGDFATAITKAQEALRADDRNSVALLTLASAYFRTGQYDLFVSVAGQALQSGADITFNLAHHHTLTGIHASTLKVTATTLAFDPMGFTGCNQKALQTPLKMLTQARQTVNANGEIFLGLRIRNEQNKFQNFNFASMESTVDTTKGFGIVRSPAKAVQEMQAIAAVLRQAAGIQ